MTGLFITFEGPDGAGKTTQIQRLGQALEAQGYRILMTREPGGTRISDHIRSLLLDPNNQEMADQAEVLLYAAARAQHVHERIIPALEAGSIVLCDRFIDASMAYQAYGLGIDHHKVRMINDFASSSLVPNRTYMLDISIDTSIQRLEARSREQDQTLDRIEQKEMAYHQRVREGFLQIARENPDRVMLVNADREPDIISADIHADCIRLLQS